MVQYIAAAPQKVSITIPALSTTATATISAAVGKQFIIWNGETTSATTVLSESLASITISGTTITATRQLGTVGAITAVLTVIDATSSLVTSVQTGTLSITTGNATGTATISAVNASNTVLQYLGYSNTQATFSGGTACSLSYSGTTVTGTVQSTSTGTTTLAFTVIEFTGAALNSSVQAFTKTWTSSGTSSTQTITSVTANNSILFYGGSRTVVSRDYQYAQLTNATTVTLNCGSALSNSITMGFYVAEFISGVWQSAVQRGTISLASVTSNTATITGTNANANINFLGFAQTSGATQQYDIIETDLVYTSPTVTAARNTGTGTIVIAYEAWDWSTSADGNTVTETITETDSETILSTGNVSFTETETETDSAIAKTTSTPLLFTETQTETDSYTSLIILTNSLIETNTASDVFSVIATQITTKSENNTTTDSIIGAATGLTNLNESGNATDTHLGIASGLGLLTETDIESDLYDSSQTQPGANTTTETVTETDSQTVVAIDSDVISENIAANDNYDSQLIPAPVTSTIPIQTGSGDDPWKRYLLWLERKKRKQFRQRATQAGISKPEAVKIAEIATAQVKKQEIELKTPYYAAIEQNEQLARHAAQLAINQIYEAIWEENVRKQYEQDEEDEFFMMMM